MRRTLSILLTPLLVSLVSYFIIRNYLLPQFEDFVKIKVERYSEANLPVRIKIGDFFIRLFPFSLIAEQVQIQVKDFEGDAVKLRNTVKDLKIDVIEAQFDYLGLVSGQLRLKGILFDKWQLNLNLDPFLEMKSSHPEELPISKIFAVLGEIPIQRVLFRNGNLSIQSKKMNSRIEAAGGSILLEKGINLLAAQIEIEKLSYFYRDQSALLGNLFLGAKLTPMNFDINKMSLQIENGFIKGNVNFLNPHKILIDPNFQLRVESFLPLSEFYSKMIPLFKDLKLPELAGEVRLKLDLDRKRGGEMGGRGEFAVKEARLDRFTIGNAVLKGELKSNQILFSEMYLIHPAGRLQLLDSKLKLNSNLDFNAKVSTHSLDLPKLFTALSLNQIPVDLKLGGDLNCNGQLNHKPQVSCLGQLKGQNLWVRTDRSPKGTTIVKIPQLQTQGEVKVTGEGVSYNAQIQMPNSRGSSEGVIGYKTGFQIHYKAEAFSLKDIENLVNLNFRGRAVLEGQTSGDSSYGIFAMKIQSQNFGIEQFELGNVQSQLKYQRGVLNFDGIKARLGQSDYQGAVTLDLNTEQIKGALQLTTLDLADVAMATDKLLHIPVAINGRGVGQAQFSGPLDFWKLNYHWRADFSQGGIGGEHFDNLAVSIKGEQGNMNFENVTLTKGAAQLKVEGNIGSDQEMNLRLSGQKWRLEDLDYIHGISPNILGNIHWAAVAQGPVTEPFFQIKGDIKDTVIENQELSDSHIEMQSTKEMFWGKLSLFEKRVDGVFEIPFESHSAPLTIKVNVDNFAYTQLLSLFGGGALSDYDSNLSGKVDLRSRTGRIEDVTGDIKIDRIYLRRRNLFIGNIRPLIFNFFEGRIKVKDFTLDGNGSAITLKSLETRKSHESKFKLEADSEIRLWHLFLPFLEDVGGRVNVATELILNEEGVQVLGTLNLNQLFIKIKGVPHPFEKMQGEVNFSQHRANLGGVKGVFAGGKLETEGFAQFNGLKNIPVQLKVNLQDVQMNIPDKVHTSGNGDFQITGHWFPYTLSGAYLVQSGLIEKEITEDSTDSSGPIIKRSVYLPKMVKETEFEPLLLDLNLDLEKGVFIKNSILEGEMRAKLQVKGPPANPILLGQAELQKKSKILFKDKIFEVQSAIIQFEDPNELNPNLYISAHSRVQDYDLTLLVQGNAKQPRFKLSSIPQLSDKDIISLLALGMTSSDLDQRGQSGAQAQQTGAEVTNQLLKTIKLDRKVKEATGWNLQVTSQVDSTKSVAIPKAIATKKLAEKVNATIAVGADQSREVKLQYMIDTNLSTVGSYEERVFREGTTGSRSFDAQSRGYFGLDLEFKREFK